MPSPFLKHIAKKDKTLNGVKLDTPELERRWKKAKKIAGENGKGDDFAYITGIFKKMTGEVDESYKRKKDCKKCGGVVVADWDYESGNKEKPIWRCNNCNDTTKRQIRKRK